MVAVLSLYDQALADFVSATRKTRVKEGDADGEAQLQDFLKQRATPQEAQSSIKELSDHAGKKYGTKRVEGKVVISQKWIDNIMGNIDHAIAVGNKLMAGAPESVSMAWFCVKLGMNAIQSNYQLYSLFGSGLTAMTELMILIPHYDKMHDQRHKPGFNIDDMTQKLFRDIVACYAAVLDFLFSVKRHVEATVLGKIRHGFKDFLGANLKKFTDKQATIMTLKAKVLEASDARFQSQMFEGMDTVQESLKNTLGSFESKAEELAETQNEILQSLQDMRSSFKPKSRWDLLKQEYEANAKKLDPFQSDTDVFPLFSRKRYAGTLVWLPEDPQYKRWRGSTSSAMLCITGQEGVGKSVAIATLHEKLLENAPANTTICHFSCTNEDNNFEDLGSEPADRIRHTLLHQLYSTLADREEDVNLLEEANKVFLKPKLSERQHSVSTTSADKFIPAFSEALVKLSAISGRHFVFLVDGLDRLDEKDQVELFEDFTTVTSDATVPIKFLTGCRINNPFSSRSSTKEQCLDLGATEGSAKDVELVLDSALASLQGFTEAEKAEAREKVLDRAAKSLAYVTSIAIPFLQQPFQRPLSRRLEALPETITDSFRQALSSMNPTYYDLLETALTWTLYSAQPVRAKEITEAFSGIYLVDLQMDVPEEYEKRQGYKATDLEAVQIQDAANRFLRIWADQVTYLGVGQNHHYVDLIDAAQVRKFCDKAPHDPNDHDGHDHPLCARCQPRQLDQGCISLPEKEVHLKLALQLVKHINSPLFQRRFGLLKPDGSEFEIKPDEDLEDDPAPETNGDDQKTNGETTDTTVNGSAEEVKVGDEQQEGVVATDEKPDEPKEAIAETNGSAEADDSAETNGDKAQTNGDHDDAASDASLEDNDDENVDLSSGPNRGDNDGPDINSIDALPLRYEIEQWAYHAQRAEALFTDEEKANDPRWKELIAELDKFALEHTSIFRRWWIRWARREGICWTEEQYLRSQMPQYPPLHAAARLGLTTWAKHLIEEKGFDPNQKHQNRLPLRAVRPAHENLDTLRFFLSLPGADPFSWAGFTLKNNIGSTLAFWMYMCPTVEVVKLFIEQKADFGQVNPLSGDTVLHTTMFKVTDGEVIRLMLNNSAGKLDVNAQGFNKNTALHLLLYRDEAPESVLDVLLEHGADVNVENHYSVRALEGVTWTARSELIEKVLAKGVTDVDDPDADDRTALHIAVAANSVDCVKVLAKHGITIDHPDKHGDTPLSDAAVMGFKDVVDTLVELGAKLDVVNKRNHTPFFEACSQAGSFEAATTLLEAMKKQGLPIEVINTPSKSKRTPLRQAATQGLTSIVEALIQLTEESGQSVPDMLNLADERGHATALHRASLRGQVECVRILLEHGADPMLLDVKGMSALQIASTQWQISGNSKFEDIILLLAQRDAPHARSIQDLPATAAANGSIKVLKALSKMGADINRSDSLGWTPLALAQKENRGDVERFLRRHTANRAALPSSWVKHHGISGDIGLAEDGLSMLFPGGSQICLSTDRPLPSNLDRFYFEITFKAVEGVTDNPFPVFGIGFCTLGASAFNFPGWPAKPNAASGISWAYHGDDGWCASPTSALHSEKYGAPDTVGCGVDLEERKIWFTRNGERLEAEHTDVSGRLFPIIGMEDNCSFETNFGSKPFVWDGLHEGAHEAHSDESVAGAEIEDFKPPALRRTGTI